jgi:hypothetical protein
MRTFINTLFTPGNRTTAALQSTAATLVSAYCQGVGKSKDRCSCFNATIKGFSGCATDTVTKGCTDMYDLNKSLAAAPPEFKGLIDSLKTQLKPICVEGSCKTAATNPAGPILRTADSMTITCTDNINLCFQSIRAGGSIAPGAHISQECSVALNVNGSNMPNSPAPKSPAPAPGGLTLTGGVSTQTQFAGTPGQKTTNAYTPASITASPAPVGKGPSPLPPTPVGKGPSPSPPSPVGKGPAPSGSSPSTTQNYTVAAAAGGGLLGLSSSFVFCFFIIIIALFMFSRRSQPVYRSPPTSSYGL